MGILNENARIFERPLPARIIFTFISLTGQTICIHMEIRYDVKNEVTLLSRDGCVKQYLRHNFRPRKIPRLAEAPHDNRTWTQFIREHIQKY